MTVCISGASGLIGSALQASLEAAGHRLVRLMRPGQPARNDAARWDPETGQIDVDAAGSIDAVIHLAGANIAAHRWSAAYRQALFDSRVESTRRLCRFLANLPSPPRVFLCASASGFYGDTRDRVVDEGTPCGEGFLADLCRAWEMACEPLKQGPTRVVHLRFGLVLDRRGGALARMLPVFRVGLGGPLGNGRQWVSWIALADVLAAVNFLLGREDLAGPINLVSPNPVTNREFARTLGGVLRRPAVAPAPAWALRLLLGPMADEALLVSSRITPKRLQEAGFPFQLPDLRVALANCMRD